MTLHERNDGGGAFPYPGNREKFLLPHSGMTLRDYFAAKAMQGMIGEAVRHGFHVIDGENTKRGDALCAERAYAVADADAMLKARHSDGSHLGGGY